MVKHLPAMRETQVQSLGWEDLLEKETATHSSTLAWKIPQKRNLVGYGPCGRKELDMTERLHLYVCKYYILSIIYLFYSSIDDF